MTFTLPTTGTSPKVATKTSLEGAVNDALALAGITIIAATWTELSGIEGARDRQPASVAESDTGTHADPVTGETVVNAGMYAWNASEGAWAWVGQSNAAQTALDRLQTGADVVAAQASSASSATSSALAATYAGIPDNNRATSVAGLPDPSTLTEGDNGYVSGSGDSAVDGLYEVQTGAWVRTGDTGFAGLREQITDNKIVGAANSAAISGLDYRLTAVERLDYREALDELIGGEASAVGLNAAAPSGLMAAATGAGGVTYGAADDLLGVSWGLKMVTNADGSIGWNCHNIFKRTDDVNVSPWIKANSAVTAKRDSMGGMSAFKIEATGTTNASIRQDVSVRRDDYFMYEAVCAAGTADWLFVNLKTGVTNHYAYFNLSTKTVGTVDAALTASVSATLADGTLLPDGFVRVSVSIKADAVTSISFFTGPTDADGSVSVTVGKSVSVERLSAHYGVRSMEYLHNATSSPKYGPPVDWSKGYQTLYLENVTAYTSEYSEDLTQAAWVKYNTTAVLDATGPHGQPCSTLTASAANGTCIQDSGSTYFAQMFSAFVRRKTGAGAIEITTDDGATWTAITGEINGSTFTRVGLAGVANSKFGFRIVTSGDEIEVALALNKNHTVAGEEIYPAPVPVYSESSDHATIADTFEINKVFAGGDWSNGVSVYADYERATGYQGFTDANPVDLRSTAGTNYYRYSYPTTGVGRVDSVASATKQYVGAYVPSAGERIEVSMSVANNKHAATFNGEPICYTSDNGMPALDLLKLSSGGAMFLRKLVVTPRAVSPRDLRTWRYSGRLDVESIIETEQIVALDREIAGATMAREPAVLVLSDDGDVADLAVFWMQRHDTGHHPEAPARMMQRNYRYIKSSRLLTPLTAISVAYEQTAPVAWQDGEGHTQGYVSFVVPSGPYKGRVVMLFCQLDTATFTGGERNVYAMINDSGGDPAAWQSPTKIYDAGDNGYTYVIPAPSGDVVILPAGHANEGRVCIPVYMDTGMAVLYSDSFGGASGTDWSMGLKLTTSIQSSEPSVALWPDGTAVYTIRVQAVPEYDRRLWATASDGITLVEQGLLPDWEGAEISASMTQLDPTGVNGPYGKIAMSRPNYGGVGYIRVGCKVDFADDAAQTYEDSVQLWSAIRPNGYTSLRSLFGGLKMALATEHAFTPGNVQYTIHLHILDVT